MFQPFQKIARLSREMIITEKLDGTNAQVHIAPPGEIVPVESVIHEYDDGSLLLAGSRSRYITLKDDNFGFAKWAADHANELHLLGPGRHFGEWYGLGIQRGYGLSERRWALFNVGRWASHSAKLHDKQTYAPACCDVVPVLYFGGDFDSKTVQWALETLREKGSTAAPGFMNPEGVVIYHTHANILFKKTLEHDDKGKGYGG